MQSRTITLITGAYNSGKTTALLAYLKEKDFLENYLCGFVSLAKAEKTCYRLKDLFSGIERVALSEQYMSEGRKMGRFFVDDAVFAWANAQIVEHLGSAKLAVFDELGRFELEGKGFDPSFRSALEATGLDIVATVRQTFLLEVIDYYALDTYTLSIRQV
ncbi:MAG: hypothetical protein JEY71_02660 [Sphaerochaeta sp.]|nr:hypothetical protein [Sphaerochaeta sp.]